MDEAGAESALSHTPFSDVFKERPVEAESAKESAVPSGTPIARQSVDLAGLRSSKSTSLLGI